MSQTQHAQSLGNILPRGPEVYSNGSYLELFRLTTEHFSDYYDLVSSQPASQAVSQLGPNLNVLLHHNPHYLLDIGIALFGALALTLIRALLCNLSIGVSVG